MPLCADRSSHAAVTYRASASATATGATTITHIGAGASSTRDTCGSITPAIPAGNAGDVLIALVVAREQAATIAAPAGWTQYFGDNYAGADLQTRIYYRVATGSDVLTVTQSGTCSSFAGEVSRFRGVSNTSPFETDPITTGNWVKQTTGDIDTGTQTTVSTNAMLIVASFVADDRTVTEGAGWSESFDNDLNLTLDTGIALHYRLQATAGAQTVTGWDLSGTGNDANYGIIFALRPASSSLAIAKPAGTSIGDVMVANLSMGPSTLSATAPAGWTLIRQDVQGTGSTIRLASYYRIVDGTEGSSFSWTLSSASHNGAVGAISSFSGADISTPTSPLDVQSGATTASSLNHIAPTVTTTGTDGILITAHTMASSATWTAPATMTQAVDAASLTAPNASGVSLQVNYEERAAAGATGTRTAVASANADTGATHSIALKASPLICFTDSFNRANGTPGSGWAVSNSGGSFGNPVIASNRLRLTDATGNVATMATLQRIFPGAGNRIEVLFDHFADGGTGADGIVVVLSDSAITPSPGGYGGSLGYAQNTSAAPSKPGFSGGWIGVGIDEFGNFANPTEGRIGGPGARADSVSIRGSGSGNIGYNYHTGTAAGLTPEIDNNGAASPAHRYRIIIDHSNGVNAYVSVERNTGTGYVTLVSPYDAKAQAGQAVVPTNWVLSYTGSTGGSTNIHEIDNLQICATFQSVLSTLHHFDITVVAAASTCTPQNVIITAKDASNNTLTSYTGPINITTSTNHGTWSKVTAGGTLVDAVADDGAASYGFVAGDAGVITLALANTHADDLTINVVETSSPITSSTSSAVNFRDSAFVITEDPVQIAGRPQAMTAALYTRVGGACSIDTNYTGSKNLDAWITRTVDDPNGTAPTIGALSLSNTTPAVAPGTNNLVLTFLNGVASFSMNTTDVGKYALNLRDDTRLYATAVDIGGASNAITTRPWLNVQVPSNPGANLPTGTVLTSAGSPFLGTVRGVLWQLADDANNDGVPDAGANLNDNTVALRFAWPTALNAVTPIAPVGGVTGVVGNGAVAQASYTNGIVNIANLSYSEVGAFTLQATATNYLNTAGANLIGSLTPVGRFTPHHFAVNGGTLSTRSGAGCSPVSSFTYMNEGIGLSYAITAQNLANATTQNYTGVWATLNLNAAASHNFGARDVTAAANLSSRLGTNTVSGTWSAGTASVTANVSLLRASPDNPDGPFNDFRIGVAPSEGSVATAAMDLDVDGNATNDRVQLGGATQIRYGRLRLYNTQGPVDYSLTIPMRVEYWNGSAFATNGLDSCTTLPRSAITMGNYQLNLAACETAFSAATISFSSGSASPTLLAPGAANNGNVDLTVNLGTPSPTAQYCSAIGAAPVSVISAARSYLLGRWDDSIDPDSASGTSHDDPPTSRANFGLNNNTPRRMIYSRENY